MTDYRDPNYRDPVRPEYRDPDMPVESGSWSGATWGWIAGIALVALVLIFAFSGGRNANQTARDKLRGIDRRREADALRRQDHRGVNPDHFAARVDEWSTGVTGIERGVGLDDGVHQAAGARAE